MRLLNILEKTMIYCGDRVDCIKRLSRKSNGYMIMGKLQRMTRQATPSLKVKGNDRAALGERFWRRVKTKRRELAISLP
jgi:hypothetical protein